MAGRRKPPTIDDDDEPEEADDGSDEADIGPEPGPDDDAWIGSQPYPSGAAAFRDAAIPVESIGRDRLRNEGALGGDDDPSVAHIARSLAALSGEIRWRVQRLEPSMPANEMAQSPWFTHPKQGITPDDLQAAIAERFGGGRFRCWVASTDLDATPAPPKTISIHGDPRPSTREGMRWWAQQYGMPYSTDPNSPNPLPGAPMPSGMLGASTAGEIASLVGTLGNMTNARDAERSREVQQERQRMDTLLAAVLQSGQSRPTANTGETVAAIVAAMSPIVVAMLEARRADQARQDQMLQLMLSRLDRPAESNGGADATIRLLEQGAQHALELSKAQATAVMTAQQDLLRKAINGELGGAAEEGGIKGAVAAAIREGGGPALEALGKVVAAIAERRPVPTFGQPQAPPAPPVPQQPALPSQAAAAPAPAQPAAESAPQPEAPAAPPVAPPVDARSVAFTAAFLEAFEIGVGHGSRSAGFWGARLFQGFTPLELLDWSVPAFRDALTGSDEIGGGAVRRIVDEALASHGPAEERAVAVARETASRLDASFAADADRLAAAEALLDGWHEIVGTDDGGDDGDDGTVDGDDERDDEGDDEGNDE